jgi:hypothetical protein
MKALKSVHGRVWARSDLQALLRSVHLHSTGRPTDTVDPIPPSPSTPRTYRMLSRSSMIGFKGLGKMKGVGVHFPKTFFGKCEHDGKD